MTTFTTSDGVELCYHDSGGDGFPLILLHGWSQTQAMFKYQYEAFAARHRVITIDQRGHGTSAKPHHGYRIARLAQDLAEFADHLRLGSFDLLGWSMGASVAWSFIDHFGTSRIRSLVLVDQAPTITAVPWLTKEERDEAGATSDPVTVAELAARLAAPDGPEFARSFERTMFAGDVDPGLWEFIVAEIATVPSYASVPLLYDHSAQDWRDVLPRIDVPTLVIGCEGSHVPPGSQRYVARSIPGAQVEVFPRAVASSHFPFLQNPAAFNLRVEKFLAEQPAP